MQNHSQTGYTVYQVKKERKERLNLLQGREQVNEFRKTMVGGGSSSRDLIWSPSYMINKEAFVPTSTLNSHETSVI